MSKIRIATGHFVFSTNAFRAIRAKRLETKVSYNPVTYRTISYEVIGVLVPRV